MKVFPVLLILGAAGFAGYWFYGRTAASAATAEVPDAAAMPGPANQSPDGLPAPGGAASPAAGGNALPSPGNALPAPGNAATDGTAPPAAQAQAFAEAETLWAAAQAANPGEPARHASAPKMARAYSAILKATYADPTATAFAERLVSDRLDLLGTALFFSRNRYDDPLFAVHTVASGDAPDRIAKQYGMSYQHLNVLRGRDINDGNLRLGDALKVIRQNENGGSYLHVSKSNFQLDAYIGGVFARRYDIAIGADATPTPVGRTEVINLVFNPQWTDPVSGKVFEPGDPGNILGGVWIALEPAGIQGKSGIGLHGYTGEDRRQRIKASNGCLRLNNDRIKELAYLIAGPQRSPCVVEIVE